MRLKYVEKRKIRYRIEPAPDSRLAMITDANGGIGIFMKPPGVKFAGMD